MTKILSIDTSLETASIALSEDGITVAEAKHENQMDHAGWLQPAILQLLDSRGLYLQELDAIAVAAGPGSYTGLRVSMASAKGICYALNKPLITVSTLEMMARGLQNFDGLICPMIDARRMEIFYSIYNSDYQEVVPPQNLILDPSSFEADLASKKIAFLGSGAKKYSEIVSSSNAFFPVVEPSVGNISHLVYEHFLSRKFADLAYVEPFYVKAFHSTQSRPRL